MHPLPNIAVHVVETPGIGLLLRNFMGAVLAVSADPAVFKKFVRVGPEEIGCVGSRPAGILPLDFQRQAKLEALGQPALPPLESGQCLAELDAIQP